MEITGKRMTLLLLATSGMVYLGIKTSKIGVGLYNGSGGLVEPGESVDDAMIRETSEEMGVKVKKEDLDRRAIIWCFNKRAEQPEEINTIYVARAARWEGTPADSEELTGIKKFPVTQLPFHQMLPGDPYWLPYALDRRTFLAEVRYGPEQKKLLAPPRLRTTTPADIKRLWVSP